jgi:hypothetical protein
MLTPLILLTYRLCSRSTRIGEGGNDSASNVMHNSGVSCKGPIAMYGLTCATRIICNNRPRQVTACNGRLLRRPLGWARLGRFCVIPGGSPIWLSYPLLLQGRGDGKFKNWDIINPPFFEFPG